MRSLFLVALATLLPLQAQPRIQRFSLPNGLRVLHLEEHEHPLVRALLLVRLEPGDTPPDRQGLPLLLLQTLGHADTADLKAEELDRLLEESGIQVTPTLGAEGLRWRLVARSRDTDRALGLLGDRLLRTLFNPAALETQRLGAIRLAEGQGEQPLARQQQTLLGDPATRATPASLGSITFEEFLAFHARVLRPDRAVLVLHGDLGLEQAKRMVLLSLGAWSPPPPVRAAQVSLVSVSTQAPVNPLLLPAPGEALRLQASAPRPVGLSAEAASLLALLIPGHGNLNPLQVTLEGHHLLATLDAPPEAASGLSLLRGRLEAFRSRGFTQADLDGARRAWRLGRSLDSLHPEAQMDAALAEALGLGVTEARMMALTLEQLNAELRSWLEPGRLRLGAAGDPADLARLLNP